MKSSTHLLIIMSIGFIAMLITGKYSGDVITLVCAFYICKAIEEKK